MKAASEVRVNKEIKMEDAKTMQNELAEAARPLVEYKWD